MADFAELLRELRQNVWMTQKELADRLWISKAAVSYYERSLRCPSPEILIKIANVFHVSTDYLLGQERKNRTLDVTGLPDEDVAFLDSAVKFLRKKSLAKNDKVKPL